MSTQLTQINSNIPWLDHGNEHWYENPLSIHIVQKKYLHPGETSPIDMIVRLYNALFPTTPIDQVQPNTIEAQFLQMIEGGYFFPGGRTLYGAGSKGKFNATMSNCYTMPNPKDSLDDIYDSNKEAAKIFKSGGGIGVNLSDLRPAGAKTNNASRTSTGAVSFMHIYNTTGSIIGFHGRRGATMIGLRISHPDIEEFVNLRSHADMKAMNISCLIDDKFMRAVDDNKDYELYFDVEATGEKIRRTVNARDLYRRICEMNWDYGDPGMMFKDTIDRFNLMSDHKKFKIDISNPCSEYLGPAYSSCNLGSLNLYNYVKNKFTDNAYFDFELFSRHAYAATQILDRILDYGYGLQPLDQNREVISKWRPIGLGFFGLADALIALKIPYDSEKAMVQASEITKTLIRAAILSSSDRARKLGSFSEFDFKSFKKSAFVRDLADEGVIDLNMIKNNGLRNAQLISIAPTGSLSLIAGQVSSGIEPVFKCVYDRSTHSLEDSKISFQVADRAVADLLKANNLENLSSEEIKNRFPWVREAADINPMKRVQIQACIQSYVDNAISSTVNLPESATVEDIEKIYMRAWESGLKGITVFRDNCKRASILNFSSSSDTKKEDPKPETTTKLDSLSPLSRSSKGALEGRTYRKRTACVKSLYVTINRDENNQIFEVFTNKSVHGCSANIATITRLTSLALRSGIKVEKIIDELKENTCQACQAMIKKEPKGGISLSCPIAIAEALESEYKLTKSLPIKEEKCEETNSSDSDLNTNTKLSMLKCPECQERTLIIEGKCVTCKRCGYSKCD